jgi:hypothetical protein
LLAVRVVSRTCCEQYVLGIDRSEAERNITDIFLRRFIAQGTGTLQAVSNGSLANIFSHLG